MSIDPTEDARRALLPTMPAEAAEAVARGEQVWDTDQLRADFDVIGFAAPFVIAVKRDTGERGSLMFTHNPRWYFGWQGEGA